MNKNWIYGQHSHKVKIAIIKKFKCNYSNKYLTEIDQDTDILMLIRKINDSPIKAALESVVGVH